MKRLLLLCLFAISLATAQAQVYGPLLTEGKTWVYEAYEYIEIGDEDYMNPVDVMYKLTGDTVINGKSYKKLFYHGFGRHVYYCALREEGSTVYQVGGREQEEKVLMDFDPVKISAYLSYYFLHYLGVEYNEVTIETVDCVTVYGKTFRRHRYTGEKYDDPTWAVEGIGFSYDGILGMFRPQYSFQPHFKACYDEDGNLLFKEDDFKKPGDATAVEVITTKEAASLKNVFDLQGRRLSEKPKRGMYIKDGKKYVVK